jgi:hypothetical protein
VPCTLTSAAAGGVMVRITDRIIRRRLDT